MSAILSGYSLVSCLMLCCAYLFFLPEMKKTWQARATCVFCLVSIASLQGLHFAYFVDQTDLLAMRGYLLLLALVPVSFYFFSRTQLFHEQKLSWSDACHFLVLVPALFLSVTAAVTITFLAGCLYTAFIYIKIQKLRTSIPRFRFERFFFALFLAITVVALLLGLALPFIDPAIFFHAYAGCLSLAMVLVVLALLVFPDLLTDVLLASEVAYANSKLTGIDTDQKRASLESLMRDERLYENENLTLAAVAEPLGLSPQQVSELVNSSFGLSFPRYVRQYRLQAATHMLMAEPDASVLSISLATGFKSQSSFYSAFKEATGEAPASYRRSRQ